MSGGKLSIPVIEELNRCSFEKSDLRTDSSGDAHFSNSSNARDGMLAL
jgi:hypothetical protein